MKCECRQIFSANFTVLFSSMNQQTTSWYLRVSYIVWWKFKLFMLRENSQDESLIFTKRNCCCINVYIVLACSVFPCLRGLFIQVIKSKRMRWVGQAS